MDLIPVLTDKIQQLRAERLKIIKQTLDPSDPEFINKLIADAINALENLYFFLNMPEDGFTPNTNLDK